MEVPPTREDASDFHTFHGAPYSEDTFPKQAAWKNRDNDMPVTITGIAGARDGVTYYQSSTGTGIPETEIEFQ
ncbi:MAG: hypothetical protein JWQ44_2827 [Chthoniobacter sp.]|nr:hypothetical protein [Chthoniobacter sp.]